MIGRLDVFGRRCNKCIKILSV